jgi:hypothetical protein
VSVNDMMQSDVGSEGNNYANIGGISWLSRLFRLSRRETEKDHSYNYFSSY